MATEREQHLEKMLSEAMELNNKRDQQMKDLLAAMQRVPQLGGELRAVVQTHKG